MLTWRQSAYLSALSSSLATKTLPPSLLLNHQTLSIFSLSPKPLLSPHQPPIPPLQFSLSLHAALIVLLSAAAVIWCLWGAFLQFRPPPLQISSTRLWAGMSRWRVRSSVMVVKARISRRTLGSPFLFALFYSLLGLVLFFDFFFYFILCSSKLNLTADYYCFCCSVDLKSLVEQNKKNFIPPTSRMTNYVVLKFGNLSQAAVSVVTFI
jgi:hypothetical protein